MRIAIGGGLRSFATKPNGDFRPGKCRRVALFHSCGSPAVRSASYHGCEKPEKDFLRRMTSIIWIRKPRRWRRGQRHHDHPALRRSRLHQTFQERQDGALAVDLALKHLGLGDDPIRLARQDRLDCLLNAPLRAAEIVLGVHERSLASRHCAFGHLKSVRRSQIVQASQSHGYLGSPSTPVEAVASTLLSLRDALRRK